MDWDFFDSQVHRTGGCWLWQGRLTRDGYGQYKGGKAHIVAYRRWVGEIPMDPTRPGQHMVLDHVKEMCGNRNCVRPDHLEPVTQLENLRRSEKTFQGINVRKTVCDSGHPLVGDNVYLRPNGNRACQECRRASKAKWKATHPPARGGTIGALGVLTATDGPPPDPR